MRRCLSLARIGWYYVAPNPMVGAVLVREQDGVEEIVGEGWHRCWGEAHAEVNCFRDAEDRGYGRLEECTLFVSLEPCSHYGKTPPCANLIVEKGVKRVVIGMLDPNPQVAGRGVEILRKAGIEVVVGVEEKACRELNKRFLCFYENHRPYVILKWAQTADGFLDKCRDMADTACYGHPVVISSAVTKQLVHQMRAENMAIMVGTNTAILDNPSLRTTRWSGKSPLRVVLDRRGVIDRDSQVFSAGAETVVVQDTDYLHVLEALFQRGVHSLMVEGGAKLLNTILSSGVWDEIQIEVGPQFIGEGVKAPAILTPGIQPELWVCDRKIYKIRHEDLDKW